MRTIAKDMLTVAQAVSDGWQRRMDEVERQGEVYNHRAWVFTADGQFVREVEGDDFSLDEHLRFVAERAAGCVVGCPYVGCLSSKAKQAQDFAVEFMLPGYWLVVDGVLSGMVLGPTHGTDGFQQLSDYLDMEKLVSRDGARPWYIHLEEGDPRLERAEEPWQLLADLAA
jgi:hypothetical protein